MRREDFIYQYLLKYNEYEKDFDGKDAVEFWKKSDETKGTSGLVFMVLRNALVHNTLETVSEIEKIGSLEEIIESLKKCELKSEERIKYMNVFFDNKKVKADLKRKNYELIDTHRKDIFKLFQRKDGELYSTIFFSHSNLLFDTTISTYDHNLGCKEYYNGYYIETEFFEDKYIIKFFKKDDSVYLYNIFIYVDKNFKPKKLYQSIDFIGISIITHGLKPNKEIRLSCNEIEKLGNDGIKELFNTYACDSTIREIVPKIKTAFKEQNKFLHIIGIQNDI